MATSLLASLTIYLHEGKIIKGKARSGAKLSSDDLPLDSLEGYIAHKVHGVETGKAAFGPGFVVAAILDWAEVCNNERGFVTIKPEFLIESKIVREDTLIMNQLEKKFHEDMRNIYLTAKKELKYNASRFWQLVCKKGGVQAAKILIVKDGGTYGFEILWEYGRLDLSVTEFLINGLSCLWVVFGLSI